jgi:hypothetical protein
MNPATAADEQTDRKLEGLHTLATLEVQFSSPLTSAGAD